MENEHPMYVYIIYVRVCFIELIRHRAKIVEW